MDALNDLILARFNYWIYVILMMIGLYAMIAKKKTLIQEAPLRSPQSIDGVSRYQRSLQEQIRALRLQLEEPLNSEIGVEDAIFTWTRMMQIQLSS